MPDDGTVAALIKDLLAPGTLALIAGVSAGVGAALVRVGNKGLEVWRAVKTDELAERKADRDERREANQVLGATNQLLGEVRVSLADLSRINTDQTTRLDRLVRGQQEQVTELRGLNSTDIVRRSAPPETK